MGSLQNFAYALTHWSFGVTVLVGLVASQYTGAETIIAIFVAAFCSTLSAICGSASSIDEEQFRRKRLPNILNFLIIWLDILTNLVAASTCARLASATVDYISKGHFREFLFGLQQHSLGEPWPDVLGVTIIIVVTILFLMGLEKSPIISSLLFLALLGNFAFFATIGSFHTITKFGKWCANFKMHSFATVLEAAAKCSFAFVHTIPKTQKNNCLKMLTLVFNPLIFYTVTAIIFSLMTHYKELDEKAIPLVQVFENRDVDWARPIIALFTICVVCLVLTEVLPSVYFSFVKLATREWQIFVSSIQYRSPLSGAPVLAIFAAGSLAAILAFACPLLHLIELLNTSCLLKCAINSCQIVYNRYKPEVNYNDCLVYNTNVQYSKLNQSSAKSTGLPKPSLKDRIKTFFAKRPNYVHRLSSPLNGSNASHMKEERECLLLDDYNTNPKSTIDFGEDSTSENEENELEVLSCSDADDSGSSTDIDLIVEEYREGLKVAAVGQFNERKPSTKLTSTVVILCLFVIIFASINISLYVNRIIHVYWPDIVAIILCVIIITAMPQNPTDRTKEAMLPAFLFPFCHGFSVVCNIVLSSTLVDDVWPGVVFWTLAGLLLFWRCDCCTCDGQSNNSNKSNGSNSTPEIVCEYKDNSDTIYITR